MFIYCYKIIILINIVTKLFSAFQHLPLSLNTAYIYSFYINRLFLLFYIQSIEINKYCTLRIILYFIKMKSSHSFE